MLPRPSIHHGLEDKIPSISRSELGRVQDAAARPFIEAVYPLAIAGAGASQPLELPKSVAATGLRPGSTRDPQWRQARTL